MTMILTNPKERTRFVRFLMVGTIGAVVDFTTFNLLSGVFHVLPLIAQAISFSFAVASNFTWNRFWTYPDSRSKPVHHQMVQFLAVSLTGLAIRTPLFGFTEGRFVNLYSSALPLNFPLSAQFLGHNTALALAVGVVLVWNFFINRFWTYNDVDS